MLLSLTNNFSDERIEGMENTEIAPTPQPVSGEPSPIQAPNAPRASLAKWIAIAILFIVIGIGGTLLVQNINKTPEVTQTPTLISQPYISPTVNPTEKWQTYTNTDFMFTFKHPDSWRLSSYIQGRGYFVTERPTSKKAGGDYTPGVGWLNFSVQGESIQSVIDKIPGVDKKEEIDINGLPATKLSGYTGVAGTVYFVAIVLSHEGKTFFFQVSTQDTDLEKPLTAEFNQILSTLEFSDQKPTINISTWKTYTNAEKGYEVKYPSDKFVRFICQGEELLLEIRRAETEEAIDMLGTCGRDGRYIIEIATYNADYPQPNPLKENYSLSEEAITVSGVNGKKFITRLIKEPLGPSYAFSENIYIKNNDKTYLLHLGNDTLQSTFDQILSTFTFIE